MSREESDEPDKSQDIVDDVVSLLKRGKANGSYFYTLTWAQSIDAKLGRRDGTQVVLSGEKSLRMTHQLRRVQDGIIVGRGTFMNDSPSLTVRLPNPKTSSPGEREGQPQAIILDSALNSDVDDSRGLFKYVRMGKAKAPWFVCSKGNQSEIEASSTASTLRKHGGKILYLDVDFETTPFWIELEQTLRKQGLASVMVEGGATVLSRALVAVQDDRLLHSSIIVITTAPKFLGAGAVSIPSLPMIQMPRRVKYAALDPDIVTCMYND